MTDQAPKFFDPDDPAVAMMASMYEGHMVAAVFGPWGAALVESAGVTSGERVADIACGTGAVTRAAAAAVAPEGSVVGVDLSPPMIALARGLGLPGTEFHEGDAQALPLKDGDFDAVLCQQGLQFVPDRAKAISEMARVLKAGGRVAIACWRAMDDNPSFVALDEALVASGFGDTSSLNVPLALGDPEELRSLLGGGGFEDVNVERQERMSVWSDYIGWARQFMQAPPFSAVFAEASDEQKEAFLAELDKVTEKYRTAKGHEIPWTANIALARKPS